MKTIAVTDFVQGCETLVILAYLVYITKTEKGPVCLKLADGTVLTVRETLDQVLSQLSEDA